MSDKYAVITDGVVTSIIVWDGIADIGEGDMELVAAGDGCIVGSSYSEGVFTLPPMPEKTHEEDVAEASQKKAYLIENAASVIDPLKDALDGGYIEEEDKITLTEWQRYRYQLTKVDTSTAPDISWPEQPS